ncbi:MULTISPECIES: hypothetical protein [Amycolatopsis]|uniref:hypothetical protein n=1 Tax=Amycolatopsis TaxID=1813 RepID=UPI000A728C70|nr:MULTISPECIES: hypothetical protein [Amycolatopsis]
MSSALDEALARASATVVVDLTKVSYFSMESAWALLSKAAAATKSGLVLPPRSPPN